jgi:hypothetical protein
MKLPWMPPVQPLMKIKKESQYLQLPINPTPCPEMSPTLVSIPSMIDCTTTRLQWQEASFRLSLLRTRDISIRRCKMSRKRWDAAAATDSLILPNMVLYNIIRTLTCKSINNRQWHPAASINFRLCSTQETILYRTWTSRTLITMVTSLLKNTKFNQTLATPSIIH